MSLAYYTMDDLRLGRGGFLQKGWTIRQRPELGEALAHYRGMPGPDGRLPCAGAGEERAPLPR